MRRTWLELLHLVAAIGGALVMAWIAAWAVPMQARDIWLVAALAMIAVVAIGGYSLLMAWRADRGEGARRG